MRARYPVLIGLSAALGLWAASGMLPAAAGVGDDAKSTQRHSRRARCSAAILPGGWRAASTTREAAADLLPPGAGARSRQRGADRAVVPDGAHRGQLGAHRGAGARADQGAADAPHGARLHGPRRVQGAALRSRRRAFQVRQQQSHRRADEHAGAGLALPCAGQDPGGARHARCAQAAARLGAVLSALSSRAPRRRGGTPRRGARRLRAHPQERPAHAAHHAGLRAACGQRRRPQAGAERAQGALREDQERRPPRRAGAAGSDRGRRASGPAGRHPHRGARRGLLRSRRGAHRRRRRWPGCGLPAVCPLSGSHLPVRPGRARQRLRDDQALRGRHCRLRPHPQGNAPAGEHRDPQGAEPQSARARGRGAEAAGRDRAGHTRTTSVRSTRWAASCAATSASRRRSTTTRAPSP